MFLTVFLFSVRDLLLFYTKVLIFVKKVHRSHEAASDAAKDIRFVLCVPS